MTTTSPRTARFTGPTCGSFYLTYHKFAAREQVEACDPQFAKFLRRKGEGDPAERFQNDWCRNYQKLFPV